MARQTRRDARVAPRRMMEWLSVAVGSSALAGSSTILLASLNATALAARPFTVIRSRLWLHVESDQIVAGEIARGAFGAIVVSDNAVAAGTGSIPQPALDTDAPWFVYEPWINSFVFGDGTGFVEPAGTNIVVDSKAMRKVGSNEDIALQIQEVQGVGAIVAVQGRMLVKLH